MRYKIILLWVIILAGSGLTGLRAQESIPASGGKASGSGGSVSYSVGQLSYKTLTGTNGSVAQGVQQAFEISIVSAIEEAKGISLSVSAYPNPVDKHLVLEVMDFVITDLSYQLLDMHGRILQSEGMFARQSMIATEHLVAGTYFVKVRQNQHDVKTFKVIKLH